MIGPANLEQISGKQQITYKTEASSVCSVTNSISELIRPFSWKIWNESDMSAISSETPIVIEDYDLCQLSANGSGMYGLERQNHDWIN